MKWYELIYWMIQLVLTFLIWYAVWNIDVGPVWIIMAIIASYYISLNLSGIWKDYSARFVPVEKETKNGKKVKV